MRAIIRLMTTVVLVMVVCLTSPTAEASGPMGRQFGVGLSLGNPTSITGKYYLQGKEAIDFHVGTYRVYNQGWYRSTLFLAGDYIFEAWEFFDNAAIRMPFYAGPGAHLVFHVGDEQGYWRDGRYYVSDPYSFGLGGRFPIGTAIQFKKAPFEIFGELTPTLSMLFRERYGDTEVRFDLDILNLAVGARFFFE